MDEDSPIMNHQQVGRVRRKLRITSAAIKIDDRIFLGPRHALIMPFARELTGNKRITQEMQGFMASDGKFYNRFQAGAIAFDAGQTKTRKQSLLSEDVW